MSTFGKLLAALVLLAPAAITLPTHAAEEDPQKPVTRAWLKYGDGKPNGKKSIAGAGEMIRFKRAEDTPMLRSVKVHGTRYGHPWAPDEDFEVAILSEDMTETLHSELIPYKVFKRTTKSRWTTLKFDEPVEVPETFWVVLDFNAEATKGVYVSYDTKTKGEYSRVGLTDEDAKKTDFGGDWMIQVLVTK